MTSLPTTGDSGPTHPFGPDHKPYEAIGGEEQVRRVIETFYDLMDDDPRFAGIRGLHPETLTSSREKLFEFITGWLGGPPLYVSKHGHPRLRARHAPFPIGEAERDQWLACMGEALDACEVRGEIRAFIDARFAQLADFMRNT